MPSLEVVQAHLRRIKAVNPSINAVVIVLAEQARHAATAADRLTVADGDLPPLHGVPVHDQGQHRRRRGGRNPHHGSAALVAAVGHGAHTPAWMVSGMPVGAEELMGVHPEVAKRWRQGSSRW